MSALGPGGEFDRIRDIWARLGPRMAHAGDDCALVTVGGVSLAIATDLFIEGRHFMRSWLDPPDIGLRAAAASLSDLAAVAAEPLGLLASVGVPATDAAILTDLMEGVGRAAAHAGAQVWGGDTAASDGIVLDIVVVGRAERPVRRGGAKAGDGLWVTGRLGAPGAAVRAWKAGRMPSEAARSRFVLPVPRLAESRWLRDRGATAMIDLSDGLVGDAGHLAAASALCCMLEADRVPVHEGADTLEDALMGGEEYELLVCLPDGFADAAAFRSGFDLPLTRIGRCEAGAGVRVLREGREVKAPAPFSHF